MAALEQAKAQVPGLTAQRFAWCGDASTPQVWVLVQFGLHFLQAEGGFIDADGQQANQETQPKIEVVFV